MPRRPRVGQHDPEARQRRRARPERQRRSCATDLPRARGRVFPITGGSLDGAAGTIEHSGGLKFSAGGKSLSARSFRIKLARKSTLSARVGKSRVILNVDTSRAKITRVGLDTRISRVRVSLTGAAARALNTTFSTHLFRAGLESAA